MAEKHEKLLSELEVRMRQLMYLCDSLKEDNLFLREQLASKDKLLKSLNGELGNLTLKYENLKVAKSLTGTNNNDVGIAKKRLLELVQDVDKCITLLKI